MNNKVRYLLGFIGISILIFCIWYFRSIVAYILISAAISILGQPLIRLMDKIRIKGKKVPKGLSAGITLVALWLFLFTFFRIFIPLVLMEANELSNINANALYEQLQGPLGDVQGFLHEHALIQEEADFEEYIVSKVKSVLDVSYLTSIFSSITSVMGNIFIAFFAISFISFFFLKDSSLFSQGITMFVPDDFIDEVQRVLSGIRKLLTRYLGGIILEVIMVMILITLGLWIVGIEFQHALICGLFSGIMNVIPYVGPWIGAAFSITIGVATNLDMAFHSELLPMIGFMVLVFALVQTIDNILFQPLIYSNSVNAHPLEIFIVIMMAGSLAGVTGMVMAIPAYTVLRVIAKEFLSGFKVVQTLTRNI
jgi:predicted PurR-regulated permease PerM